MACIYAAPDHAGPVFAQLIWRGLAHQILAACGYAELHDPQSLAELNAIERAMQLRPEVLQLRLHNLMRKHDWTRALVVSRKLRVAPNSTTGFLHAGFVCMNWAGRRRRNGFSCEAPAALRKEPIYHYNMGCYEALFG